MCTDQEVSMSFAHFSVLVWYIAQYEFILSHNLVIQVYFVPPNKDSTRFA